MKVENRSINEIKPYEKNPRINDGAVAAVAASIREFGFKVPIVIDKNGVIVAGHTRYKAAASIGMTQVPCIVADDLTPQQIKAFRLADNKVSELATWDFELLGAELDAITELNMEEFGFLPSVDLDQFFVDQPEPDTNDKEGGSDEQDEEPKGVQCPHCGEWFTP